jgi:hypothetical protein
MKNLTLPQLLMWINKAEETGHYRGYSRHELALEYQRRTRNDTEFVKSFVSLDK